MSESGVVDSPRRAASTSKKNSSARVKRAPPPSADPATDYAERVVLSEELAGPHVREACARHLRDLQDGPARGLVWSPPTAQRALDFFPQVLRLNGGQFEGKPFVLHGSQEFIIGSLFGWLRADGTRRFRTAYVEQGKGNGKSPIAGGVGLYLLTSDGEARAEIYSAASKKDQAMILFRDAVAMVDQSPLLSKRLLKTPAGPACANLAYISTGSYFKAIASEEKQSGPRPHGFLIDELHEHHSATVVNMASAGQKFRRQPMTFEITNSGVDKNSICFQHRTYSLAAISARNKSDAGFDDEWFAYVCGLDEGEDPFESEACWPKANPLLGHTIQKDYLRKQVREARGMPAQESTVRRLNFCEWVDAANPWISGPLWMKCEEEFDALAELKKCDRVVGAIDLSGSKDLTALALTGIRRDGKTIARVEFWTPQATLLERSRRDLVPYDAWVKAGFITTTPGRAVGYEWVAQRIVDLQVLLPQWRQLAFDPYRIKYLETELDQIGAEIELVEHPQGYMKRSAKTGADGVELPVLWFPRSIEILDRDVSDNTLRVEKNPVLTWNSASAVLEADPKGNKIFTKRKSTGRIDGVVALAMADGFLHVALADEQEDLDSFIFDPVIR